MVQAVALPDGNLVNFPDEMSSDDIAKAMPQAYAQYQASKAPQTAPQEGFVERAGRYESENLQGAAQDIAGATKAPEYDNPDDSFVRKRIENIGQYIGGPVLGAGAAVTSPLASTASAAVEPLTSKALPADATQAKKDALAQATGGALANVGLATLGGYKGLHPNTQSMGNTLPSATTMRQGFLSDESSGGQVPAPVQKFIDDQNSGATPKPQELPPQELQIVKEAGADAGKDRTIDTSSRGLSANQKISAAFDSAKQGQRAAYDDLNEKGSQFSVAGEGKQIYNKLDELTNYLSGKVADGTDEATALSELQEIQQRLKDKYSVEGKPAQTSSILDSNGQPIVTKPAESGVAAYGVQPSDLVDLKTGINSLLKSDKFTTAGQAKLLDFKNSVQKTLDNAAEISPDFKASLGSAEQSANKVGQFKAPELQSLWKPEDYYAWKAAENDKLSGGGKTYLQGTTPGTFSRAGQFFDNLDSKDQGRIVALARALPHNDAVEVLHDAIVNSKNKASTFSNLVWQLRNLANHPVTNLGSVAKAAVRTLNPMTEESPLLQLNTKLQGESNFPKKAIAAGAAAGAVQASTNSGQQLFKDLWDSLKSDPNLTAKDKKSILKAPLKPQSSNERDNNGLSFNPISDASASESPVTGGSSQPDSKKNFNNIDTQYLVDNLSLNNPTQKALAKSNADTIVKVASQEGADPVHMLKMAASESRLGTNTGTGNKGLFQITDNAYKLLQQKYPQDMRGLKRGNTADNVKMAILLGNSDAEDFKKATGANPKPEEKRLLHVLGLGSTLTLAQNQNNPVAARTLSDSLQAAAANNRNLFVTKDNKNVSPSLLKKNIISDYNKWDKYIKVKGNTGAGGDDMEPVSD